MYNNNGDDFTYQVEEIKVPDEFQSTVTQNGNNFTIKNTFIGTTTEPPTTESSTTTGSSSEITNSTSNEDTKRDSKHLPNAGEKVTKTALVGLFFIILALIFVFARKFMLKNKEKK